VGGGVRGRGMGGGRRGEGKWGGGERPNSRPRHFNPRKKNIDTH